MHLVQNYYTTVQKFGVIMIKKKKKNLFSKDALND